MMRLAIACILAASVVGVAQAISFASIGDFGCVPIGGWHEEDQIIVAKQFASAAQNIGNSGESASFVRNRTATFLVLPHLCFGMVRER